MWRSLLEHPGWQRLEKWLQDEKTLRAFAVLNNPIHQMGQVFSQEFLKGEGSGLSLVQGFPATQVEALTSEIQKLQILVERESDAAQDAATADAGSRVESSDFHSGG
jgi:hypothetical protein